MGKKIGYTIIFCIISIFIFSSFANAQKMAQKQELIYNSIGEPATLDPALSTGTQETTLELFVFEGLIRLDKNMNPIPGIAKSWQINQDLTEYIFYIREDARWSDGKPVTAYDFEYSMKRALNPELASYYAYMLYYIKNAEKYNNPNSEITADEVGVEALDEKTLKITLEKPCPYFLQLLAHNSYLPVRQDVVEVDPEGWANNPGTYIGNGPFKMVQWDHYDKIVFVKNENYWDADNVKLEKITVTLIDNIQTAIYMFMTGKIDLVGSVSAQIVSQECKDVGAFHTQSAISIYYYSINGTKEGLDNPLVRKALALAINRQIIVDEITGGGEIPAFALVPKGMSDAEDGKDFREVGGNYFNDYDIETAKALLAEAGYPNGEGLPEVEILYNVGVAHELIALVVQNCWNQLGVKTKFVGQEWGVCLDRRMQLDFDVARVGWGADYLDPISFLEIFQTGMGLNDTGYSNPTYDALIHIAKLADSQEVRMFALHEAERILIEEDMVIIPIFFYTNTWLAQPYVKDVINNPFGIKDFKNAWIAE